jgi:hypothetical protein
MSRVLKGSFWTEERIELLHQYHDEGKTGEEIARLFGGVISREAINMKRSRLGLVNYQRSLEMISGCLSPQEASIWHLVDLKRAGHSPTRTELKVEEAGCPMRFSSQLPGGLASSPAALCMEG